MTTLNRISAASLLAAASLTFSSTAWSLGLGDVTVESFLNQPLQVKIDLVTRESDDLASVTAKLASADDYELIGANREAIPVPIRFLVEDIEGDAYILGTSQLPIGNPIVRLIVEVNWSSGRLLREYTVFLDPPTIPEQAPHPRVDMRKAPPAVETATESAQSPAPANEQTTASEQAPAAQTASTSTAPREPVDGEYGPVSNGETLWVIALNWSRGTGLDPNKVMIAIQRENPNAFLRGNINLLKRGAILRMPQADDVNAISMASALSEVTEQTEEFQGRRSAEPAASPLTPLLAEEAAPLETETPAAPEDSDAGETDAVETDAVATVEPALEPALEEPEVQDQLELVPPSEASELDSAYGFEESEDGSADASVTVSTLRQDLARSEEDLITQQQENEYMVERIKELETQLLAAEENKVKDADLANMEERLREERLAEAATARQDDATPWYSGLSAWLIGLLVLVVVIIGWQMKRRRDGAEFDLGTEEDQLREIKDEAEEVLRVLEDSDDDETGDDEGESPEDSAEEKPAVQQFGTTGDDAEVLDEESSDPEIQLDLARAYISMGDKEAARVILDEVESNGSEEQREEAKKMLEHLAR
jgi:pilus assembly protein FimV